MKSNMRLLLLICLQLVTSSLLADSGQLFSKQNFSEQDAVLVTDQDGSVLYQWQADQLLVPASLTKLLTSYLAIDKWGLSHRFYTEFYQKDTQLWVKGYGDPYLVSEEIDKIVTQLSRNGVSDIESIHIDSSYFEVVPVPGRSSVADPYNAPLSAVAANFNTVFLQKVDNRLISAEPQTPLTATAQKLVNVNKDLVSNDKKTRVNLVNANNAQTNFAELLAIKLSAPMAFIEINQHLPSQAKLVYRHDSSFTLRDVVTAAMKYSNNFISNQVFLKLAESSLTDKLSFDLAQSYIDGVLQDKFSWQNAKVLEGAGLSRSNKLSANQINELLILLQPHQDIFKEIMTTVDADVYAKTGTLNGVSNYAGYINFLQQQYRFVFMFNRSTPYGYRDRVLQSLVQQLSTLEKS